MPSEPYEEVTLLGVMMPGDRQFIVNVDRIVALLEQLTGVPAPAEGHSHD